MAIMSRALSQAFGILFILAATHAHASTLNSIASNQADPYGCCSIATGDPIPIIANDRHFHQEHLLSGDRDWIHTGYSSDSNSQQSIHSMYLWSNEDYGLLRVNFGSENIGSKFLWSDIAVRKATYGYSDGISIVPEPISLILVGTGLIGLAIVCRYRNRLKPLRIRAHKTRRGRE